MVASRIFTWWVHKFFLHKISISSTGSLESLIGDVEIALLALEDTIDAREMQEKQLDQRFQLAIYQERRKAEFNELASKSYKIVHKVHTWVFGFNYWSYVIRFNRITN